MQPLRVALDASPVRAGRSGVGRYVEQLAMCLPAAGVRPVLLSNRVRDARRWLEVLGEREPDDREDREALATSVVGAGWTLRPTVLWQAACLPRLARRAGAELIHYTTGRGPLSRWPGGGAARLPSVLTVHDLEALLAPEREARRERLLVAPFLRAGIQAADAVIAVSETTADELRRHFPAAASKLSVIPEAASGWAGGGTGPAPRAIAGMRERLGLPERYWLHVGSMTTRKNLRLLLRAYALARADAGQTGELPALVIAGPPGRDGPRLRALAAMRSIDDRLFMPGFVDEAELPLLYAGATAYVAPSLHEGFGLAVLDALACGLPLVCADAGALPEVVGEAALYVDPRDEGDIAAGLLRLHADDALRETMKTRARAQAARFSWARTAERTAGVYRQVLASHPIQEDGLPT